MARAVIDDPRVKESIDSAKGGIKRKLKEEDIV